MINFLYAITIPGGLGNIVFPNTRITNPTDLIANILFTLLEISAVLLVVIIAYAGITYATAGDDTNKTEQAKKTITYAIIGLIIMASALVITRVVISVLSRGTLN